MDFVKFWLQFSFSTPSSPSEFATWSAVLIVHLVFGQALNGTILTDDYFSENVAVPAHINKLPFVTWPALRAVLVDRQTEDAKIPTVPDPQLQSPSNSASRSLSPIAERLSISSKTSSPRLTDDQTSTRSQEERNKVSIGTNRSTPESQQSDESSHQARSSAGRPTDGDRPDQASAVSHGKRPGSGARTDSLSDISRLGAADFQTGHDSYGASEPPSDGEDSVRNRAEMPDLNEDGNASPNKSNFRRRSTLLSPISALPRTPMFDDMTLSGSPHAESPVFLSEPDTDVLDSLVQISRLVMISQRFEKRLARIEVRKCILFLTSRFFRTSSSLATWLSLFTARLTSVDWCIRRI